MPAEPEQRPNESGWPVTDARWHAIFDNSTVGISITDRSGHFLATNRAYQEMVGYSEEDLRGMSYMDLTLDEDRPASAAAAGDHWSGLMPNFRLEKRYRRKDGHTIWVRISVSKAPPEGAGPEIGMAIVEDITEQKLADAKVLEYERVVEGLQEMILVVDRKYRYLIANQAFLDYRGLKREEVVGHTVAELIGEETFESVTRQKIDECFQGKIVKCETAMTFPGLGRRELLGSYFPIDGFNRVERVAVVFADVTDRKQAQRELENSFAQLHALNAQLQTVREEERTKLARDLHDQLGQALTAIRIDLAALKRMPAGDPPIQRIDGIVKQVDETIQAVRRISTELRPSVLDDLGLVAALEWATEEFQERTGIECQLSLPAEDPVVSPERATAVLRILQESLTNIARHSGATQAGIRLEQDDEYLALEVRDNGRGFGSAMVVNSLGILGMRERAFLHGGDFFVGDEDGCAVVRVRIPNGQLRTGKAPQ